MDVIKLLQDGTSYTEIQKITGLSKATISYHAKKIGIVRGHKSNNRYDWSKVRAYYESGHRYVECKNKFGFSPSSWTHAVNRGDIIPTPNCIDLSEVLIENSSYHTGHLKRRLLEDGLLKNICYECSQLSEWNDKKLTLQLDHINGINTDNRINNLRILCPNCHSQTKTFAGRNKK